MQSLGNLSFSTLFRLSSRVETFKSNLMKVKVREKQRK